VMDRVHTNDGRCRKLAFGQEVLTHVRERFGACPKPRPENVQLAHQYVTQYLEQYCKSGVNTVRICDRNAVRALVLTHVFIPTPMDMQLIDTLRNPAIRDFMVEYGTQPTIN
jgi:hypothetical protein